MDQYFNCVFHIWLTLLVSTKRFELRNKLLAEFQSAEVIFNLKNTKEFSPEFAKNQQLISRIIDDSLKKRACEIYKQAKKDKIEIVCFNDSSYPCFLKEIYSPPLVLYYRGDLCDNYKCAVSVVGSRNADGYGRKIAYDISKELSQMGMIIISGMARGIDSYAHMGALDGGGKTIAVLGSGVDYVYPPENKKLYNQIIQRGAVLSDYLPGSPPQKQNFPARNRIIAGLSMGTLVIEARKSSGALITSDSALRENRTVYAVPGNINNELSQGTNSLIKSGCVCVTCARDIVEDMGFEVTPQTHSQNISSNLNDDQKLVYRALEMNVSSIEEVCSITKLDVPAILSAITFLKVNGLIEGVGFGSYATK